jgi:hypothetical protein
MIKPLGPVQTALGTLHGQVHEGQQPVSSAVGTRP